MKEKEVKEPELVGEEEKKTDLVKEEPKEKQLIEDQQLLAIYERVLDNIEKDREEVSEILANFLDMVMNDGESSAAAKEAVVSLMKIKTDTADKVVKIADLMTRIKLKEPNTFPRYLAAQQKNVYNFGPAKSENDTKNMLMDEIEKASKKGKK
jgi:hypothetical protein